MFIDNANPLNFTYKITDSSKAAALVAKGVTLNNNGTLTVNANGLVDTDITVTATDGTTTLTLPTVHIFAIDAGIRTSPLKLPLQEFALHP
jgi:hypothetical protein